MRQSTATAIVLTGVTIGAVLYFAKIDKYKPDHTEEGADLRTYTYGDVDALLDSLSDDDDGFETDI